MLRSLRVRDYMLKKPITVKPDADIFEAIHQILVNRISGVTVVDDDNRPIGILSELDCLRAILWATYHEEEIGSHPVKDHMTSTVETVSLDEDIIDVAQSMLEHKRRRRPVVDRHGRMVGQVTCRQLLRAIKEFEVPPDRKERR
ncbi:MAG: CBS domain-containing protein [Pseudomonadales bacterium]